jgi:predicted GNAT superfamily acetyltransferase
MPPGIAGTGSRKALTDTSIDLSVFDSIQESTIVIRDVDGASEIRAVEALQKEVWGCVDLDVVPFTLLVAGKEVGATLIGAYDDRSLVGFVYGFTGYENRHVTHHSHMLAVKPAYRNHQLGYKLKLAQREQVLSQGIERITWTFDPLQSLNAHLNFRRLGVVSDTYKTNFYGEATSSFLHQIGTDRLWVTWLLDSQRVRERLQIAERTQSYLGGDNAPAIVRNSPGDVPLLNKSSEVLAGEHLSIEIPLDINKLQHGHPKLAIEWREATRWAFKTALDAGYLIEDFYRVNRDDYSVGVYLLTARSLARLL